MLRSSDLSSPVVGLHSVGCFISGQFCWVCLGTGEFLRPQGAIPPGFYPLRGCRFIAWRLRRPKKGNADGVEGIFGLAGREGFSPATGPTLKMALYHIRVLVGCMINNQIILTICPDQPTHLASPFDSTQWAHRTDE